MSGFDVQRDGGDGDSSLVAVRAFVPFEVGMRCSMNHLRTEKGNQTRGAAQLANLPSVALDVVRGTTARRR